MCHHTYIHDIVYTYTIYCVHGCTANVGLIQAHPKYAMNLFKRLKYNDNGEAAVKAIEVGGDEKN